MRRSADLVGQSGFEVLAVDRDLAGHAVERLLGRKRVFRLTTKLGRTIRATANHRFLTIDGWHRLDHLEPGDHLAMPRELPGPDSDDLSSDELALLGLLIGDGCTLPRHTIQFTARDRRMADVAELWKVSASGLSRAQTQSAPGTRSTSPLISAHSRRQESSRRVAR